MKRSGTQHPRKLFSEFSFQLKTETLSVRIYQQESTFICEREIVERDGASFTMLVPVEQPETARKLLATDPCFTQANGQIGRMLVRLDNALRDKRGKPLS